MQHRYVLAKVRREVDTLLRDQSQHPLSSSPSKPNQPPSTTTTTKTSSHFPFDPTLFTPTSLPYTHAVFLETLRLYPPIPIEIKQTLSPTTLPDGTFLPTNSIVLWCVWAMNRSHRAWGPDADSFRPERFLCDQGASTLAAPAKSAAEFPVFNGGQRLCLGKKMAEAVAVQVIASIAWTFDFVPAYEGTERRSKSSLTLPMEGGLPVFVKVRNRGIGAMADVDL